MVIIKRYPNRKLYNTEGKQYITLDGVSELIRQGGEVQVIDHETGEDLTAVTLTQIILEREKKHNGLLSNSLLTSLIRTGGDRLTTLQRGLQSSIQFWGQIDEEIRERVQALVHQGELTAAEGEKLVENLIKQGLQRRDEVKNRFSPVREQDVEAYLVKSQIPTRDDLKRLHSQLEELASKLEEVRESTPE